MEKEEEEKIREEFKKQDGVFITNLTNSEKVSLVASLTTMLTAQIVDEWNKPMPAISDRMFTNISLVIGAITKNLLESSNIPYTQMPTHDPHEDIFRQDFSPKWSKEFIEQILGK